MKLRQITFLFLLSISMTVVAADVVWFDGQHPVSYQVVGKTDPVVKIALQMFESDMLQVTGMKPVESGKLKVEGGKRIAATIRIVQGNGMDDGFRPAFLHDPLHVVFGNIPQRWRGNDILFICVFDTVADKSVGSGQQYFHRSRTPCFSLKFTVINDYLSSHTL